MSDEAWEERWKRELEKRRVMAQKAWDRTYSTEVPIERIKNKGEKIVRLTFLDWVENTDDVVKTKHTIIELTEGKPTNIFKILSKQQNFLVIGGDLDGSRVTAEQAGENYVAYNCGSHGRYNGGLPKVVLISKGLLK